MQSMEYNIAFKVERGMKDDYSYIPNQSMNSPELH